MSLFVAVIIRTLEVILFIKISLAIIMSPSRIHSFVARDLLIDVLAALVAAFAVDID